MKVAAALVALVLTGCPKERPPSSATTATGDAVPVAVAVAAPVPLDAAVAKPAPYHPAALTIVTDEVAPAQLDWDRPIVAEDQLDQAIGDVDAAKARLGRFVVRIKPGWRRLDRYDPKQRRLAYADHGLEGVDGDPPLSFAAHPTVTRGEMPLGGHARLDLGYLRGTIAVDAAGAEALIAADAADPLVMQLLVELDRAGEVDGADVIFATLHGVRIVREGAREIYLEGKPTRLGR